MAYQTLKYGTKVVIGLSIVGATIFQVSRIQVKAVDFIEIIEGVRERQMIVTSIGGSTTLGLQIAPNRKAIDDLTVVIDGLITNFVNQTAISDWVANYPSGGTNPPHWTKADLFTYLDIGVSGDWSRSNYTSGTLPLQVYTNHLNERYKVLQALVYTRGSSTWGSNAVCKSSDSYVLGSESYTTNFVNPSTNYYYECEQAAELWGDVYSNQPMAFPWEDYFSYEYSAEYCTQTNTATAFGSPPKLTQSASIVPYLYVQAIGFSSIGGYWGADAHKLVYNSTNRFVGSYSSENVLSRLTATTRSISIPRTDYYYFTNILFETVSVPSNTAVSSTAAYIEAPAFTAKAVGEWSYNLDSTNDPPVGPSVSLNCFGMDSLLGSISKYFSWGSGMTVTDSGETTRTNLMPMIHKWGVTRCVP